MKSPREYQVKSGWILCKRSKTTPNADAIFRPLLLFSPRRHSPKVVSPSLSPSLDLMHATRKGDEQRRRRGDRHAKASEREGSERAARFGRVEEERTKTRDAGCWMQGERRREKETETAALASSYPAIVHKSWKEGEGHRQQILLSFSKQCRKLRSSETTTATTTP